MSEPTFEIAFSGALTPGVALAQAKRNLAGLLKADLARVEPLFSGRRFVLKRGLDQATALKYQQALCEAGLVVEVIEPAAATEPAGPGALAGVTVAEPGVRLVPPAPWVPLEVDLSGLALAPPGATLAEPRRIPELQVDTGALTLADPGVTLVEPEEVEPLSVETGHITLA